MNNDAIMVNKGINFDLDLPDKSRKFSDSIVPWRSPNHIGLFSDDKSPPRSCPCSSLNSLQTGPSLGGARFTVGKVRSTQKSGNFPKNWFSLNME